MIEPIYDRAGVVIYNADARALMWHLPHADAIITDPVWPNCEHIFPGIDARALLADTLEAAHADRVVIELGCDSDPRFLTAVPDRWPYLRTCWLEFACPSYKGRVLNTGDVAYVFGEAPAPKPGAFVMPGKFIATKKDPGFTRWNDTGQVKRGGLDASRLPHPTARKLQHVSWLVKWFGGDGLIVDPFMGSGTTALACKNLGKRFIGVEIEERFCRVAISRLRQDVMTFATSFSEG